MYHVTQRFKNATNTSRMLVTLDLGTPSLGHKPIPCPVYHTTRFHIQGPRTGYVYGSYG